MYYTDLDKEKKEIYCLGILKRLFSYYYLEIIDKLTNYIDVSTNKRTNNTLSNLFRGFTSNSLATYMLAIIVIKKFVNVDLYDKRKNLMSFVSKCVTETVRSKTQHNYSSGKSIKTLERFISPVVYDSGSSDDKVSIVELETNPLKINEEHVVMLDVSVKYFLDKNINKYNLNINVFNDAVNFYLKNNIKANIINEFLLTILTSEELGGSKGLKLINRINFTKLIVFTQMMLIDKGYIDIAHLVTAVKGEEKQHLSETDRYIQMTNNTTESYRLCNQCFVNLSKNFKWNEIIDNIRDELLYNEYYYYTADSLWEYMKVKNNNNSLYKYTRNIITNIYGFIYENILKGKNDIK